MQFGTTVMIRSTHLECITLIVYIARILIVHRLIQQQFQLSLIQIFYMWLNVVQKKRKKKKKKCSGTAKIFNRAAIDKNLKLFFSYFYGIIVLIKEREMLLVSHDVLEFFFSSLYSLVWHWVCMSELLIIHHDENEKTDSKSFQRNPEIVVTFAWQRQIYQRWKSMMLEHCEWRFFL